jgi:3-oxoacyl-[acyl-carrier protein] reductase
MDRTMDLHLEGRTAVVTGGSQGLGFACAQALAAEGVNVVLAARDADRLETARAVIGQRAGARVVAVPTDVTDADQVEALLRRAQAEFGGVDICIANAAGPAPSTLAQATRAQWLAAFEGNLLSIAQLAQASLPAMASAGWGRFIAISSVVAKQPMDKMILSNAIRPGVGGLVKTLSSEYGRTGVTVNALCPGFFATPRLETLRARAAAGASDLGNPLDLIPVGRMGRPEEFGATAAFLCSDHAAYITGTNLVIDGGYQKSWY